MSASAPDAKRSTQPQTGVDRELAPRPKVLVKEKIGDSGVALLREHFDVEVGLGRAVDELSDDGFPLADLAAPAVFGDDHLLVEGCAQEGSEVLHPAWPALPIA